jgi:hypothetical protein
MATTRATFFSTVFTALNETVLPHFVLIFTLVGFLTVLKDTILAFA